LEILHLQLLDLLVHHFLQQLLLHLHLLILQVQMMDNFLHYFLEEDLLVVYFLFRLLVVQLD
jgi:hypothetical protein